MSHTIVLGKNGIISTKKWVYDEEKNVGAYVYSEIDPNKVLFELNTHIDEIEEGFTLRDYFRMIVNYEGLQLLDPYFQSYIDEYLACPLEGCVSKDMPYLRLGKVVTLDIRKEIDLTSYFSFDGGRENPDDVPWAIEFTPLSEILDIPIKILNLSLYINEIGEKVYKTYVSPDDMNTKLFDFVSEIIWELSFTGTPKERAEKQAELDETVEGIKNGTVELHEWDELKSMFSTSTEAITDEN